MRYMIINKADADSEAGKLPAPEVAEAVGGVVEEADFGPDADVFSS